MPASQLQPSALGMVGLVLVHGSGRPVNSRGGDGGLKQRVDDAAIKTAAHPSTGRSGGRNGVVHLHYRVSV